MEDTLIPETDVNRRIVEDLRLHEWRVDQLRKLGLPRLACEIFADFVDWHEIAALVQRGCPTELALEIAR